MSRTNYSVYEGQEFGELSVLSTEAVKGKITVRCTCGNTRLVYPSRLYSGKIKHCDKCNFYLPLLNTKHYLLNITDKIKRDPSNRILILCKCDCGNEKYLRPEVIRESKSCGCLSGKRHKAIVDRHGMVIDKLTILDDYKIVDGNAHWKVRCVCGYEGYNKISSTLYHFKYYGQASCGCNKVKFDLPNARLVYSRYKSTAKKYNREFEFSFENFLVLIKSNCHYCGSEPSGCVRRNRRLTQAEECKYNGLDRIDSTKGYTKNNSVPCCKLCNYMKSNLTVNEFRTHITKIYTYYNVKSITQIEDPKVFTYKEK